MAAKRRVLVSAAKAAVYRADRKPVPEPEQAPASERFPCWRCGDELQFVVHGSATQCQVRCRCGLMSKLFLDTMYAKQWARMRNGVAPSGITDIRVRDREPPEEAPIPDVMKEAEDVAKRMLPRDLEGFNDVADS